MAIKLTYEQVIDLCKKENERRLRYEDFITGVLYTLSDPSVTHPYPRRLALKVMEDFIAAGNRLDELKKALFYGKNVEQVEQKHRQYYDYDAAQTEEDTWNIENNKVLHGILGMATEDVELVEVALAVYGKESKELDVVNLLEEIGDSEFYKAVLIEALCATDLDIKLKRIWATVLLKLNLRYEGKFSQRKAINRDLTSERALLEKQAGA